MLHLVNVMGLGFLFFWVLVLLGRDELGYRGFVFCVVLWTVLLVACTLLGISPYVFVALQALIDVVLLLVIFGRDITIR